MVLRRAWTEATVRAERVRGPARARALDERALLRALGDDSLESCWDRLRRRSFLKAEVSSEDLAHVAPGERERVLAAAERAASRDLDLLGTGPFRLGRPADWHTDVKTATTWPPAWWRDIEYAQLDRPSDVKVPWEISRLQWLLPAGQAYLLDGDERHAHTVLETLDEWIEANPYGESVNWVSPMEAAIRILSLTWLFHALAASDAWQDGGFRLRFLRTVYLHGDFVARNLERSDVNGNHLDADAAGIVFAGLFFGSGRGPARWAKLGWSLLLAELPRQVTPDGVDFEMSTAYHRFVTELFLLPALLRRRQGLSVPQWYLQRLEAMARFVAAYARPDGSSPAWGDADDARALPLGGQPLGDHRYLGATMAAAWGAAVPLSGPRSEVAWLLGPAAAEALEDRPPAGSELFPDGGCAVLRAGDDHVFVDCGPVGLAGRGGHGHNDITSVDATLAGVPLLVDPGSYVYTASPEWRNRFRSTAAHNAVQVDGHELNRFGAAAHLWSLRDDARPVGASLVERNGLNVFRGGHTGYELLHPPVWVSRKVALETRSHRLLVVDELTGVGGRSTRTRWHLAPGARLTLGRQDAEIEAGGLRFTVVWSNAWQGAAVRSWFSPSYGIRTEVDCLELTGSGSVDPLVCAFGPRADPAELRSWAEETRRLPV
ncbi:MAG: alginate lyase family protein [Actinobacteria bacterium]|nr:alginate lyase family protein [Actinomycetota bacterium]